MARPSSLLPLRELLLGLRAGQVPYEELAEAATPVLEARGRRVLRLWETTGHAYYLSVADLVQEQLLQLWRAVDRWDPTRGPDLVRYVDAELGRGTRAVLRKACGYPDARRQSQPARRVAGSSPRDEEEAGNWLDDVPADREGPEELAARHEAAERVLGGMERGFDRDVVQLVVAGASLPEAGRTIYADPVRRIRYRLDSRELAERSAVSAGLRIAASVGGA
jgi:hypothetical protein